MKIKIVRIIFSIAFVAIISSCSNKIDINEPYKEQMVIYGLLNQTENVQYIKINKAFLGTGDNYGYAQIADSINYDPQNLSVKLEVIKSKVVVNTITLHDTIIPNASSGTFNKEKNIIYCTYEKLKAKDDDGIYFTYNLRVKNLKSGYEATASTNLVDKVTLSNYSSIFSAMKEDGTYTTITNVWTAVPYAKTYNLRMIFYYRDFVGNLPNNKSIEWNLGEVTSSGKNYEELKLTFSGEDFFDFLQSQKDVYFNNTVSFRVADSIRYQIYAGGDELAIYTQVNKPSSGLLLEKPIYTNVKNGLGIFSCRYKYESNGLKVSDKTKDQLHSLTELNFQ